MTTQYRNKLTGAVVEADRFDESEAQALCRQLADRSVQANAPAGVTASDQGGFWLDTGPERLRVAIGQYVVQHPGGGRSLVDEAEFCEQYQRVDEGSGTAGTREYSKVEAALKKPAPSAGKATKTATEATKTA